MEDIQEKGCVYFFRHIGLTPIKIGFSTNPSPLSRFNQFKTYAPFGSELVGFIPTSDARGLELKLHSKYADKRISGEWFEITDEDVNFEINYHSSLEDINERNGFQKIWAKYLEAKKDEKKLILKQLQMQGTGSSSIKEMFLHKYRVLGNLNIKKTAGELGVSRRTLYNWISEEQKNSTK